MEEGLIGVIVPVYKVEKYIAECIESILAQTYTNFRLILVDDGTPDNAGNICDEYAKKDSRITVIHQENAGVTRARARGVEEADDCKFITFVDSDDTLAPNCLQELIYRMDDSTDIAMSYADNEFIPMEETVSSEDFVKMLLLDKSMCIATWGKLYRKELLCEYIFDIPRQITLSEDIIINLRIAFGITRNIKFVNKRIYRYELNPNGVANTFMTSPEYEEELLKLKIDAIPKELREYYTPYTIERRLLSWRNLWGYKYFCKDMVSTAFYRDLKNDIETTGYHLGIIERVLFNHTNPILRFIIVNIKKIKNRFTRYII